MFVQKLSVQISKRKTYVNLHDLLLKYLDVHFITGTSTVWTQTKRFWCQSLALVRSEGGNRGTSKHPTSTNPTPRSPVWSLLLSLKIQIHQDLPVRKTQVKKQRPWSRCKLIFMFFGMLSKSTYFFSLCTNFFYFFSEFLKLIDF